MNEKILSAEEVEGLRELMDSNRSRAAEQPTRATKVLADSHEALRAERDAAREEAQLARTVVEAAERTFRRGNPMGILDPLWGPIAAYRAEFPDPVKTEP